MVESRTSRYKILSAPGRGSLRAWDEILSAAGAKFCCKDKIRLAAQGSSAVPQNFVSATAQSIAMARASTAAMIAVCAGSCEKSAIYDGARLSHGEINARRIKACKGGVG